LPAPAPGLVPVEAGMLGLTDEAASCAGDALSREVRVALFPRRAGRARVVDDVRVKIRRLENCMLIDGFGCGGPTCGGGLNIQWMYVRLRYIQIEERKW
jgi:hypothetical protein